MDSVRSLSESQSSLVEIDKLILKFRWNCKGPRKAKTILKKKNKVGGLTLSGFKTYFKTIVIKTVWSWHMARHIDLWDRIGTPDINSPIYSQLMVDKGTKTIQWGRKNSFSTNGARTTGHPHTKE